ncbi:MULTISPECIES: hypothetical protein [Rufibacter]|uniref:Lipoprotein n=1 Tax=Rufibacter quisquiliarum TaxID=1549639 RepID=A0A839GU27_9BACT|nr:MULTISPECIES: hypothetical protein [Rufibacter]MBA9078377.1 hypothetical protein [Rufibacter quisquiliarum]
MRPFLALLLLCTATVFTSCSVADELMADPVMTAKINGREFTACSILSGSGKSPDITLPKDKLAVTYDAASGNLSIIGTDACNDSTRSIHLTVKNVRTTGTFTLNDESPVYQKLDQTYGSGAGNNGALKFLDRRPYIISHGVFTTDAQHVGTFTVTEFNAEKRRFSANFELEVFDAIAGKGYRITEGRLKDAAF